MLHTLLEIGQWQSQGKSEWDRFLEKPKVEYEDKNGNEIKNYILPIVFDLDECEVIIDAGNLAVYDEGKISKLIPVKIQGGNNKAIYTTVPLKKLNQVYKTFFGKENTEALEGELKEAILKTNQKLLTAAFSDILDEIFLLKKEFIAKLSEYNEKTEVNEITPKAINDIIQLSKSESIVAVTIELKSQKHLDSAQKVPFSAINDYNQFLREKYFGSENNNKATDTHERSKKMCYASGLLQDDVEGLNLSTRYSLNKMFVEETRNYATGFDINHFTQNYQVSKGNQELLDYASNYLLNQPGHKVKIANIDHVIIPQFLSHSDLDLELALSGIKTQTDLLFNLKSLESYILDIQDETEHLFWINFIAFESDGNFFKSTEVIKDVSSFYFRKILKTFLDVDWDFKKADFTEWESVMASYGKPGMFFNFNTIYKLIPLRKEKKNKALSFMKTILENRKVDRNNIFGYFCELLLCHYYERYQSYPNISDSSKDYFSLNIRNSTFKYLALLEALKKLNLIDMNEEIHVNPAETGNKYDEAIQGFFAKMQLNPHQQAMFYLGRMLNSVEFIQKGKKKTVIEKVNFNGMDRDDIQRLRLSLIEKAKQYSKVGKVVFTDSKFGELFDYNQWSMNPQEAVFFLMTGYSFGISSKEVTELEEAESEEQEN